MAIDGIRHRKARRLQRSHFAAAVFAISISASSLAFGGKSVDQVIERSKTLIAPAIEFEARAAKAFQSKSLPELENLYADIAQVQEDPIKMETEGIDACGCDVALINLSVIVGFAMNKLDGQGRYEPWMLEQSLELLDEYRGFLSDCARDAGAAAASTLLTAQHLKAL